MLMLLIRASKLLCCLIYFFQFEIKLPYLPTGCVGIVDFVNLTHSFHCNIYFCYVVSVIPTELVSILPHAGS